MNRKLILFLLIGIIIFGIIAYYPVEIKLNGVVSAEDFTEYGEKLEATLNTTLAYIIPFYSKWTYSGSDANYINYNIQFSISGNLLEDSFTVSVYLKAVRNDNGNYKVIFNKTETRTGLSDGSETFSYSGSYSVATLLENDLGCSQSGSYQIDFYIKFTVTATGSKSGQQLVAKDYTLFQSLTFDWTVDVVEQAFTVDNYDSWRGYDWASRDNPDGINQLISAEDNNFLWFYTDPGCLMFFSTTIDTSQDWIAYIVLTWYATGSDLDKAWSDGICVWDFQANDWYTVAKPDTLPTSNTRQEFEVDFEFWYDTDGTVKLKIDITTENDLYFDYIGLKLTPYGASWITFIPVGLSGAIVGVAVTLFMLKSEQELRRVLLIVIALATIIAIIISLAG